MFYDRLKDCCEKKGLKVTNLTSILETSKGTLSGWKNGASPNSDFVVRAAEYFEVSADYLLGLTDDPSPAKSDRVRYMLNDEEASLMNGVRTAVPELRKAVFNMFKLQPDAFSFTENDRLSGQSSQGNLAKILEISTSFADESPDEDDEKPVVGNAAAGAPLYIVEEPNGYVRVPKKYIGSEYFVVRAVGDSMINAGITDGDYCVFQQDAYQDSGRIMCVQIGDEFDEQSGTIKRVYFRDNEIELRSENPKYEPMFFPYSSVSIKGVLATIITKTPNS